MALLTKREFAEQCGIKTGNLSVYISRRKVVVAPDGDHVDTNNDTNNAFLALRQSKSQPIGNIIPKTRAAAPQFVAEDEDTEEEDDEDTPDPTGARLLSLTKSEKRKKHFDALRAERAAELDLLKINKQKGEVIPSGLILPLFTRHNHAITQAFKISTDEILRRFAKRKALMPEEVAEYRSYLTEEINRAMDKATAATERDVELIISDFTETRGVGERR